MFERWLRRKAENEPEGPTPWAAAVEVSRLPDRTVQEAEYYLKTYRFIPMLDRQELASRLMSVIHTHVDPPPPLDAHPLDVFATVLAARRRELGIG